MNQELIARQPATVEMAYNIAEVAISYRLTLIRSHRQNITNPAQSADFLRPFFADEIELREQFYIILLNQANDVIAVGRVSSGGITGTVADCRLILCLALRSLAVQMIVAHNHPSGNLQPSAADREMTQKLKAGAALVDIRVLDHLILTNESYFSFADEGLM